MHSYMPFLGRLSDDAGKEEADRREASRLASRWNTESHALIVL